MYCIAPYKKKTNEASQLTYMYILWLDSSLFCSRAEKKYYNKHKAALVSIALELKNFEHKNRSYVSPVASPNLAVHVSTCLQNKRHEKTWYSRSFDVL